jgi:hypothetical protein
VKTIPTFKKFLNESSSKPAAIAHEEVIALDSPDMEIFFKMLSDYFKDNADELTNMDAKKIADHILAAHDLVKKRKSN